MLLDILRIILFILFLTPIGVSQSTAPKTNPNLDYQERLEDIITKLNGDNLKPRRRMALQLNLVTLYGYNHPTVDSLIKETHRLAVEHNATFYIARSKHIGLIRKKTINQIDSTFLQDIEEIKKIRKSFNNHLLDKWIHLDLGIYYTKVGDFEKAETNFDLAQEIIENHENVNSGSIYTYKGMLYQRKREYKKALESYNIALTQPVVGKKFIYNSLAKLYSEMGDFQNAHTLAQQALNLDIQSGRDADIESNVILGDLSLSKKDTSEALSYLSLIHI